MAEIKDFIGKVFTSVEEKEDSLEFLCSDGSGFRMYHEPDCCEHVYLEDIIGDLNDLIGKEIKLAYEAVQTSGDTELVPSNGFYDDSFTWTFYHFATDAGYVTLRWFGTSNGYYSESVGIAKI